MDLDDIPDDLKEGISQLMFFDVLSDEFIDRFIEYHDDNRLFPKRVLISIFDYSYLTEHLSINVPDYLTINQVKELTQMVDSEKCTICGHFIKNIEIHLVKEHNYQRCPVCDSIFEPNEIKKHLEEVHYQRCPVCNKMLNPKTIDTHLIQEHSYKCPVCNKSYEYSKEIKFHRHLIEEHHYCPVCCKLYGVEKIKTHLIEKHNYIACPICKRLLKSSQKLGNHLVSEHNYQKCPECNKILSPKIIGTHLIENHNYILMVR